MVKIGKNRGKMIKIGKNRRKMVKILVKIGEKSGNFNFNFCDNLALLFPISLNYVSQTLNILNPIMFA